MVSVKYNFITKYYYIEIDEIQNDDKYMAGILKMSLKKYQQTLIKKFNAVMDRQDEIFFNTKDEAQKAGDWFESIRMMNKLKG